MYVGVLKLQKVHSHKYFLLIGVTVYRSCEPVNASSYHYNALVVRLLLSCDELGKREEVVEKPEEFEPRTFWVQDCVLWPSNYRIAGNFEGENLHEFHSFVAICESFSHEIWGCGIPWYSTSEPSVKVFSAKIVFFINSQKFSLSKVFFYTVTCKMFLASSS